MRGALTKSNQIIYFSQHVKNIMIMTDYEYLQRITFIIYSIDKRNLFLKYVVLWQDQTQTQCVRYLWTKKSIKIVTS